MTKRQHPIRPRIRAAAGQALAAPRRRWRAQTRRRLERRMTGHRLLTALAEAQEEVSFVEIGAGDGVHSDHLYRHIRRPGWRGVMVEPVPYVFERLRGNLRGIEGIALENCAIADHDGTMALFYVAEPHSEDRSHDALPDHYHLLGSFSREILIRQTTVPQIEELVTEIPVPCLTPATLLDRHGLRDLDVLVIDAEGLDCTILQAFDLERLRPRVIAYEDVNATAEEDARCRRRLAELGYEMVREEFDTWCFDSRPDDGLTDAWKRIRADGPAVPRSDIERWFAPRSATAGETTEQIT